MPNTHPIPEFLTNENLRLILFGGKGGVGKTTMAAMTALYLARTSQGRKKILIISTDPAHSLSDSLGMPIGDRVTPVSYSPKSEVRSPTWEVREQEPEAEKTSDMGLRTSDNPNLYARELDAAELIDQFKRKNQAVMGKLAERGTYFDQEDITDFLDLSLPGMDEVMAIIEMAQLLKRQDFDTLIVDTAPTGHTVRMLNLPEQMKKWIEVMDLMQHKHRYMFRHFTGKKYVKDECDLFLENLSSDVSMIQKMLSNRETTRFVPVLIPELMSVYETKRLLVSLEKIRTPVREIIVNRVAQRFECPFCTSRRENQKQALQKIDEAFSGFEKIQVPLFSHEINGIEALEQTADYLAGLPIPEKPLKTVKSVPKSDSCVFFNPGLEFILFGGKGGVGKTTLASAAALHLARQHPEKKILLFSTDPAHSLSDSLDIPIGNRITPIQWAVGGGQWAGDRGQKAEDRVGAEEDDGHRTSDIGPQTSDIGHLDTNLFALEIDPEGLWMNFKESFKKDVEALFDHFLGGGADIRFDRQVMTEMLEMAPPGLDEIMSLDKMMELRQEKAFDIFVLDTSPTGHLLRFLELPHLVRQWLRVFFRLLMKYKGVVRLTGAAEKALALSKNVRKIQESLVDIQKTRFVSVTIPERMGFLELERLMNALEKANVPCEHVIMNMVLPWTDCGFCARKRMEQQDCIQKTHARFHSRTVVQAPLFPDPVRGVTQLKKVSEMVFCRGER